VQTLNQTSFHMRQMVRVEVEVPASMDESPVDFGGHWSEGGNTSSFGNVVFSSF
jgi:hypothetical protein